MNVLRYEYCFSTPGQNFLHLRGKLKENFLLFHVGIKIQGGREIGNTEKKYGHPKCVWFEWRNFKQAGIPD